jgi:hypothetical protein
VVCVAARNRPRRYTSGRIRQKRRHKTSFSGKKGPRNRGKQAADAETGEEDLKELKEQERIDVAHDPPLEKGDIATGDIEDGPVITKVLMAEVENIPHDLFTNTEEVKVSIIEMDLNKFTVSKYVSLQLISSYHLVSTVVLFHVKIC